LVAKYTREHKYFLDYAKHFIVNRHVSPSDNSKSKKSTCRNQVESARAFNVLKFFTGWNRPSVTSTNEQKCTEVAYKLRVPTT
jgi:hypothetical protein